MNLVLIVDDEPSIRALLSQLLRMNGCQTLEAANGHEALRLVAEHTPDLVILDRAMPQLNGLEACRRLKENPFTSQVPILMLTAQNDVDARVQGFDAGADDYLSKPFDPRELVARVRAMLRLVRRESDRNPSSGLPGGRAISEALTLAASNGDFSVCYFDIDRFKPFADAWGFAVADEIIARTGHVLRGASQVCDDQVFAGHIGGDDFVSVAPPSCAEDYAGEVLKRFDASVRDTLSILPDGADALQSGFFVGTNRDGDSQSFEIIRLSAVVVHVRAEEWVSPSHLGVYAARLKREAKARGEVAVGAL